MTQDTMQELSRRIIQAAHLAVAMHLQAQDISEQGVEANHWLHADAVGGADRQRSTDGQQPPESALAGAAPIAGREAA